MDINSYILRTAKLINEGRDWEVGADDYEDEEEFKATAELVRDRERSERDGSEEEDHAKRTRSEIKASGNDKEIKSEAASLDDILGGKLKDPGAATGAKGVKGFKLDKVLVNGQNVTKDDLKSSVADPEDDAGAGKPELDFDNPGAYVIQPGDKVRATGSITYGDGKTENVELEVQGGDRPDSIQKELAWLNEQPYVKQGVCEYYAILSLLLKAKLSGEDQKVAMDELADQMNKDSAFRGPEAEGPEDDSDDSEEKTDRFDDTIDFYQSDDEREGDTSPEYGSVGRWGTYSESVGKNFVKWALMG